MAEQLQAAWAILKKDLAIWVRSPAAFAATLLGPLVLLLVLGLEAAAVTTLPAAVVNLDQGPAARVLERTALDFEGFQASLMPAEQAENAFTRLAVSMVLFIPVGFSADLAAGRQPTLFYRLRNFSDDSTFDMHRDVATVVARFLGSGAAGPDPVRINVAESDVHARDAGFVAFEIMAILAQLIVQAGLVNAGLAAAREWETGAVKEFLLSPARPLTLIAGKVAAGVIVADVLAGVVAAVALAAGMLPPLTPGAAGLALAGMTLLALFGAGLGVAAAAWLRAGEKIGPLGSMTSISLFFLAGGILVLAYLPPWLRTVAYLIPNTYAVHALRGVLLYQSTAGVGRDLLALALAALAGLAVGVPALRRGLEH